MSPSAGPARPGWRRWSRWAWPAGRRRFPDELSGGERQRVAIARAVVGDRRLLLADEPSGALDSVNAEEVMQLLHEACQRGVAAVVVTHDAQLASLGRPGGVPARRAGDRADRTARRPGVAAHAGAAAGEHGALSRAARTWPAPGTGAWSPAGR